MEKPTAFIHDWMHWPSMNALVGRVSDHPHQDTFTGPTQMTSDIVAAPEGYKPQAHVETRNTIYVLCGPYDDGKEKEFKIEEDVKSEKPVSA